MGGLKALLIIGCCLALTTFVVGAILSLAPYVLALVVLLAIARMLVRGSGCKDEAHSPSGPGQVTKAR